MKCSSWILRKEGCTLFRLSFTQFNIYLCYFVVTIEALQCFFGCLLHHGTNANAWNDKKIERRLCHY